MRVGFLGGQKHRDATMLLDQHALDFRLLALFDRAAGPPDPFCIVLVFGESFQRRHQTAGGFGNFFTYRDGQAVGNIYQRDRHKNEGGRSVYSLWLRH